ncbi:uncharacterized protein LOC127285571 [Leptopilina boulardi]|uniref:uncharacterized protein LOC127285571 n=1 Tax=Leptopilina boulardi TaxID=63433 RepID=UPI0021F6257B|nr:uncharacterized protein LOC127285571 [Leptopilina boulardi]
MAGKRTVVSELSNEVRKKRRINASLLHECEILLKSTDDASSLLPLLNNDVDRTQFVTRWVAVCEKNLETLRSVLNDLHFSSERERCLNLIQEFVCLHAKFENSLIQGAGIQRAIPKVNRDGINDRVRWADCENAFKCRLQTSIIINLVHLDISAFLDDACVLFEDFIKKVLQKHDSLKVYAVLTTKFKKIINDEEKVEPKYFNVRSNIIFPTTVLIEWYSKNVKEPILKQVEEFEEKESQWTLHSIIKLEININKYNAIRVGSYIDLPIEIKAKRACINVKNMDTMCFKWAVLSALHPIVQHPELMNNYFRYGNELNFTGIEFPVSLKDITKFEKQNDISINLYGLRLINKKYNTVSLHLTSEKKARHINLLRVESHYENEVDSDNAAGGSTLTTIPAASDVIVPINYHYVWIKNLSALVSSQVSSNRHKKHICDRCLHYFVTEERLARHEEECKTLNECKINLPKPGQNFIQFKNYGNREKVPFVIYADCECLLNPVEDEETNCNTEVIQHHEMFSIGYYLKCSYDDSLSKYNSCPDGTDAAKWFAQELKQLAGTLDNIFKNPIPMDRLTHDEIEAFVDAQICHICEGPFLPREKKVRDHSHLTGKYRGAAHEKCNLNYQDSRVVPVVFHNLSGYDAHFIIRDICLEFSGKIELLPLNKEKYISFTKYVKETEIKFRFIDSFKFMASSLEKLASYLSEYKIVNQVFSNFTSEEIELLTRKGVLPYEYLDSRQKLEETNLPAKEKFYSTLNDSTVSDEDYLHAQRVWSTFNCSNLGEYVDLYMKTDVLLLADIFENFRDQCLQAYRLDPAHYYTTPGLTWDAMLKYTNVRLELLTDIDKLMFFERGVRGGISQCSNRYACANNPFMENFNKNEEVKYIMYFDANNLYGWGMVQPLPYGGFEWVQVDDNFDFNISDDSPFGYILEVDLDYPIELHNSHSDFPFCSEHSNPPSESKQAKLLTTLNPKRKYIIHYRVLKQVLANGLKLVKIHRVMQFNQSTWLKPYIDFNTAKRAKATNEFEKNLFKLMNNAVYGKTMENVRKHVDVKLVTKWEGRYGAEALISKPNFHSRSIFCENLVAIELRKTEILMNKPIYIGFAVLDVSKLLIYDFHYDYMLKKYGESCKLMYTDTDSLIYEIKCADIYVDMKEDIHKFDTSDYPKDNIYNIPQANNKVLGLMKDECSGKIITEFVGLRSKMYSIRVNGQDFTKKAKGVRSLVVKKYINFNDYTDCLQNFAIQTRTQHVIRSRLHKVETVKQLKVALSPMDDKRYLLPDSYDTLAWGHYRIEERD